MNAVTVAEIAFRSTAEEVRDRLTSPLGAKVRDVYAQLDDAIGSFVSRTRPDDLVLFISDHGFQSVTRTIHMDHLLNKFGFLE